MLAPVRRSSLSENDEQLGPMRKPRMVYMKQLHWSVANGKAPVPGVGFDSLGRGVKRMPGMASLGNDNQACLTRWPRVYIATFPQFVAV